MWFGACTGQKRTPDKDVLSDRLVNLLISENLKFTQTNSDLLNETKDIGLWMRKQLVANPVQYFSIDAGTKSLNMSGSKSQIVLSQTLIDHLVRLDTFFKRNASVPKTYYSIENIRQAILSEKSIASIKQLIIRDKTNNFSETGGVASLDESCIHFLPVESNNEEYAKLLSSYESPSEALMKLNSVHEHLPFLKTRAMYIIKILEGNLPNEAKTKVYREFLNLFLFYSRHSYVLDQSKQYSWIAKYDAPGYYLGLFHVHPQDNAPSPEDRIESILRRNLIIMPTENGFDIHYLFYGAHPKDPPEIITYRDAFWNLSDDDDRVDLAD